MMRLRMMRRRASGANVMRSQRRGIQMTDDKGQSSKASKPRARKISAAKSPPPRESKPRPASASAAKSVPAKPPAPAKKPAPALPSRAKPARSQAAAPLLARAEKKISTTEKPARVAKPATKASYQPKTEPPKAPVAAAVRPSTPRPPAMFDVFGFARPWMNLGWRMTATGMSMQARLARAALEMPPAATAMRQGTKAMNAWLGLLQGRPPKTDEKK